MNEIVIIIILILLNGIFSMSEIALISARKSKLSSDARKGSKAARTALKLVQEPNRFLSTVQIGITLIGILTGIYSGDVLAKDFAAVLRGWGIPAVYSHQVAQTLIVIVVTYFTIILGELVPKRIGLNVADKVSKLIAPPMYILSLAAMPFVWILSKSTAFLIKLLGIDKQESKVTEEEIKSMIEEGTQSGEVQEVEQDIMDRVFVMGDLTVASIMTHRNDIVYLDISMTAGQVERVIEEHIYEAYPVIEGNPDKTVGIITLKDLVLRLGKPGFTLAQAIKSPVSFPENMTVYKALEQLKAQKTSRAFVYDEFGSFRGMVTLKDILEGLVGSIEEPHEEPAIIKRSGQPGWLVDGQCPFYDFLLYFEREELYVPDNYNTVGGLVLEQLEHIPRAGETVGWNGFTLEIVDMDGVRIDKILVTLPDDSPGNNLS